MGELNGDRHIGVSPHALERAGERGLRCVGPQAEVIGRDSALGKYGSGFNDQQRRSRAGQIAEVDQVPVGSAALVS